MLTLRHLWAFIFLRCLIIANIAKTLFTNIRLDNERKIKYFSANLSGSSASNRDNNNCLNHASHLSLKPKLMPNNATKANQKRNCKGKIPGFRSKSRIISKYFVLINHLPNYVLDNFISYTLP